MPMAKLYSEHQGRYKSTRAVARDDNVHGWRTEPTIGSVAWVAVAGYRSDICGPSQRGQHQEPDRGLDQSRHELPIVRTVSACRATFPRGRRTRRIIW